MEPFRKVVKNFVSLQNVYLHAFGMVQVYYVEFLISVFV